MMVGTDAPRMRVQHDQQQERRHGQHGVGQAHDQRVGPASVVAGHGPEHHADAHCQRDRQRADGQRDPATVDRAPQDVATDVVAAERVRERRRRPKQRRIDAIGGRLRDQQRAR